MIVAAGDETTLNTLDTLFLERPVDVEGLDTSFTAEINVTQPDNIVYMNSRTVTVVVTIGSILTTQTFDDVPVSVTGLQDGMNAVLQTSKVSVTLTGPETLMAVMNASRLTATVSAQGFSSGTFDLPVILTINHNEAAQFTYSITPQSVAVALSDQ